MSCKDKIKLLTFLIFGCYQISISAENIDILLSKYEEAADLSKKTRTESLGHYTVITRRDLDVMQAYNLSDVLKSLKLHSYLPNRFGIYQLTSAGSSAGINTSYRLYIDDHEVSSINTDNPFLIFDNYPLDGIDHIEIYYGAGAVRLGNEPSLIIIKLYTKEPSRENTALVRASASTRKDHSLSFNDARVINPNLSYNLVVNHTYLNFPSYHIAGGSISRDTRGSFVFFKIKYHDTTIDVSYAGVNRDAFGGLAVDFSPTISKTKSEDFYINITQRLLEDRSLKLNLSFDTNTRKGEFGNELQGGGVFASQFYPYPPDPLRIPLYYYENRKLNKYMFYISKEFKTDKNVLLTGVSYKIKENNIENIKYTTLSGATELHQILPINRINLFTVFVEDQFNLTDRHLIFTSLKYDNYQRDGGFRDISEYVARFGFTSFIWEKMYLKGFLTRTYIPPSFFEMEMSRQPEELKCEKLKGASLELGYKTDGHSIKLFYGYANAKDMITYLPYAQNISKTLTGHMFVVDYEYMFNQNNKVSMNIFKTFNDFDGFSSTAGGSIKLFNSKGVFDVYNELTYRGGYTVYGKKIDSSLNYNIALKLTLSRNISVGIKGENLFNSSPKSVFVVPSGSTLVLPSFDRRFIVNVEKVF